MGVSTFYNQFRHRPVGPPHHPRLPRHGLPRERGRADPGRLPAPAGDRRRATTPTPTGCSRSRRWPAWAAARWPRSCRSTASPTGGSRRRWSATCSTISCSSRRAARPTRPPQAVAPGGEVGEIRVGLGSCCVAQGSGKVHRAIEDALAQSGAPAVVKRVGCVGMCHQTPLVELIPPGGGPPRLFSKVDADDAAGHRAEALQAARHSAAGRLRGLALARSAADRRDRRPDRPARHRRPRRPGLRVPRAATAPGHGVLRPARSHSIWTSICGTTASWPCAAAWNSSRPSRSSSTIQAERAARPRRGRLSHRDEVGEGPRRRRAT